MDASHCYNRNVEIAYPFGESEYASLGPIHHIACLSITPSDEIRYDSSMLRYFVEPPSGADLHADYYDCLQTNAYNRTLGHPNRLDNLVKACLQLGAKQELKKAHIVTSRGILKRLMLKGPTMELNISCMDGILYIEEHDAVPARVHMDQISEGYHGYAFEAHCTSDPMAPHLSVATKINTSMASKWCSVVSRTLGDLNLVFAGEVDCVRGQYTGQSDTFLELKTVQSRKYAHSLTQYPSWYLQNYLLGVPEVFVGYRDANYVLEHTDLIRTEELLSRRPNARWDPRKAIHRGYELLQLLREFCMNADASPGAIWRVKVSRGTIACSPRRLRGDEIRALCGPGDARIGLLPARCALMLRI